MTLELPPPPASLGSGRIDRRRFIGLAGLGAGAMALAACGGPTTAPPAGGAAGSSGAAPQDWTGVTPAKEITFWSNHPGASEDVEKKIISAFNASGAGITVKLVTAGADYEEVAQKFQVAQTGGGLPDLVIFSDVWWFRYYMQKSILPLAGVIGAAGIDPASYRQGLYGDYQYSDAQWAIPYARSTPIFYYNKEHWAKAGLEDRAPKTWDEMAQWAPKLMAANPKSLAYQHPALAGYAGWSFQNILWGYGGGWSKEWDVICDSDASVAAMQFLQDSVYKDKWAGVSSNNAIDDLSAEAVSCTIGSTGSLVGAQKSAKFDIGVGFLPGGPVAATKVCPTGGAGIGIPNSIPKENQLAAATFLKFLTSPENSVAFSEATGYMPVRQDADVDALLKKNPLAKTAIDQLAETRTQDNARVFFPGADQEIAKSCQAILTQQAPVKGTMTALKATLEKIYTGQVKPNIT